MSRKFPDVSCHGMQEAAAKTLPPLVSPLTPVPDSNAPKMQMTFDAICSSAPELAHFVYLIKRYTASKNKPDDAVNCTAAALSVFHVLCNTPLASFEAIDWQKQAAATQSAIGDATRANHALKEWQARLSEELVEMDDLLQKTEKNLTALSTETLQAIEKTKEEVIAKYESAINDISNTTASTHMDSFLAGGGLDFNGPIHTDRNKPKFVDYKRPAAHELLDHNQEEQIPRPKWYKDYNDGLDDLEGKAEVEIKAHASRSPGAKAADVVPDPAALEPVGIAQIDEEPVPAPTPEASAPRVPATGAPTKPKRGRGKKV